MHLARQGRSGEGGEPREVRRSHYSRAAEGKGLQRPRRESLVQVAQVARQDVTEFQQASSPDAHLRKLVLSGHPLRLLPVIRQVSVSTNSEAIDVSVPVRAPE